MRIRDSECSSPHIVLQHRRQKVLRMPHKITKTAHVPNTVAGNYFRPPLSGELYCHKKHASFASIKNLSESVLLIRAPSMVN